MILMYVMREHMTYAGVHSVSAYNIMIQSICKPNVTLLSLQLVLYFIRSRFLEEWR